MNSGIRKFYEWRCSLLHKVLVLSVALTILLGSCCCTRRIYIPGESHVEFHTDTLMRTVLRTDTVVTRDSVLLEIRGDTVCRTIVRERLRYRTHNDTVVRVCTDTVRIKEHVPVEISSDKGKSIGRLSWVLSCILCVMIFAGIRLVLRKFTKK